jgi:hypothetical protein
VIGRGSRDNLAAAILEEYYCEGEMMYEPEWIDRFFANKVSIIHLLKN